VTALPDLYRTASRASLAGLGRVARPIEGRDDDELLDLVADRRVVMIGEASHGSADFSRERARITERLIEEHGFTVVEALDDFHGFPAWMWRNTEVVRFIGWLRDHNDSVRDPRRKVRFRVVGARGELDVGQLARQRYGNHAVADRADHRSVLVADGGRRCRRCAGDAAVGTSDRRDLSTPDRAGQPLLSRSPRSAVRRRRPPRPDVGHATPRPHRGVGPARTPETYPSGI